MRVDLPVVVSDLVVGVIGTTTRTRAYVGRAGERVVAQAATATIDPRAVGEVVSRVSLRSLVERVLRMAGASPGTRPAALYLAQSGLDDDGEATVQRRWIEHEGLAERAAVVHLGDFLLDTFTDDGVGVALIAGTGSQCFGRGPDGVIARAGGFGWVLGDEGSAFDVGCLALRAATQSVDGRVEAPALLSTVLAAWGLTTVRDLIAFTHDHVEVARDQVARLAVPVATLADDGDPAACAILTDVAAALGSLVQAVTPRVGVECPPLVLAGGLLVGVPSLRQAVRERLGYEPSAVHVMEQPADHVVEHAMALADAR